VVAAAGIPAQQTRAHLELLAARELLSLKPDGISFHDLQRDFLLLHADDLTVLHDDLLAVYRALLPPGSTVWRDLPAEEPYIWDHLLYHLHAAGDGHAIAAVATDLAYLARRSFGGGPYAAEADLKQAAAVHLEHPAIGCLLRMFGQWGSPPHRPADGLVISPLRWPAACTTILRASTPTGSPTSCPLATSRRNGGCRARRAPCCACSRATATG
jgi:hypothetical protein